MTEYCRLCAELKESCEIVASVSDVEQSMEQKLRTCCQWTIENIEHRLPHSVCSICLDELNKCWLFSQSVQLAQQKLIEIFGKLDGDFRRFWVTQVFKSQMSFPLVKAENDAEVDIETTPLATEMVQIVYDCPDYSNNLPSPVQPSTKPSKTRKKKKKSKRATKNVNPLESNENEAHSIYGTQHQCTICNRCFSSGWNLREHIERHSDDRPYECWLCQKA